MLSYALRHVAGGTPQRQVLKRTSPGGQRRWRAFLGAFANTSSALHAEVLRYDTLGLSPAISSAASDVQRSSPETSPTADSDPIGLLDQQGRDHRVITRRMNPGLGCRTFSTAQQTIQGDE